LDPIDRDFGDAQAADLSSDEDLGIPEPVAGPHMWQEPQHRLALKSLESTLVVGDVGVEQGPNDPIVDPTGHEPREAPLRGAPGKVTGARDDVVPVRHVTDDGIHVAE